ncbi:MAG: dihydrofolate reductase [Planctomycetota bacterium]
MSRGIIVAMTRERVIGLHGRLPWHYPADLKRFKRTTLGSTVIMGRLTWESIGCKALPGRRNLVVSRAPQAEVETFATLAAALAAAGDPVWFVGGARLYAEALEYADFLDVTWVPDTIDDPAAVRFPVLNPTIWEAEPEEPLLEDPRLGHQFFRRRGAGDRAS